MTNYVYLAKDQINIKKDALSDGIVILENAHHEIHDGNHYHVSGFESKNDTQTIIFGMSIPVDTYPHFIRQIRGTSQLEVALYEDSGYTGGSSVTPINSNRNSSNTPGMVLTKDPTIVTSGSLIASESSGLAGENPAKSDIQASASRETEFILKDDSKYLLIITSRDASNVISYEINWYEEETD